MPVMMRIGEILIDIQHPLHARTTIPVDSIRWHLRQLTKDTARKL